MLRRGPRRGNDDAEDAVVEVLVEVLRGCEFAVAYRASGPRPDRVLAAREKPTSAGAGLVNVVCGCQVSLEDVGSVKGLFESGAGAGTEGASHGTTVMGEGVAVLVVLAGEALCVVLACHDGTLLGAFLLVREHVGGEVAEDAPTVGVRTSGAVFNGPSRGADAIDGHGGFDRDRRGLIRHGYRREPGRFNYR